MKRGRKGGVLAAPTKYALIQNPLPVDAYTKRRSASGHYREALQKLATAKRGTVLCFESLKCRGQIGSNAKKLGYTVHYAEHEGKLYVQIVDTGDDK